MSFGVTRICRLRRLGPGVHAGSSSRGQSFRYHLCPTGGEQCHRGEGRTAQNHKPGSLSHDHAHPSKPQGFLVTSA